MRERIRSRDRRQREINYRKNIVRISNGERKKRERRDSQRETDRPSGVIATLVKIQFE